MTSGSSGQGNDTVTFTVDPSAGTKAAKAGYDSTVGQIVAAAQSFLVEVPP